MDDDEEEEVEDNSSRRGIILFESETVAIAALLNAKSNDHIRMVWQERTAIIWPMRLRPPEYTETAD